MKQDIARVRAIAEVLKRKFNNLTAIELIELGGDILEAIRKVDDAHSQISTTEHST